MGISIIEICNLQLIPFQSFILKILFVVKLDLRRPI